MSDIEINNLKGLSTGFTELDSITKGLHKSSLNVIAGRPAMGKTALMLNLAVNIAKEKVPVLIFSLELSKQEVVNRIIASEAMIPYSKFIKGILDDEDRKKIDETTMRLSETQILIDDTATTITEIEEECRRLKSEKNIGLIVIDYLQLVSADKKVSREQELSDVTITLKNLSKELNIPILVTSQLSRKPENRHDKGQDPRPTLKDFKYSGALVQDADVIMFLYRDEYYYIDTEKRNIAEIRVAKNKFGKLGTAEVLWLSEYMKFANLDK